MQEVTQALLKLKVPIVSIRTHISTKTNSAKLNITIEVSSISALEMVIQKLRLIQDIESIERPKKNS